MKWKQRNWKCTSGEENKNWLERRQREKTVKRREGIIQTSGTGTHREGFPWHGGWRRRLTHRVLRASWNFLSWNRKREITWEEHFPCFLREHEMRLSSNSGRRCDVWAAPLVPELTCSFSRLCQETSTEAFVVPEKGKRRVAHIKGDRQPP